MLFVMAPFRHEPFSVLISEEAGRWYCQTKECLLFLRAQTQFTMLNRLTFNSANSDSTGNNVL